MEIVLQIQNFPNKTDCYCDVMCYCINSITHKMKYLKSTPGK
jgi:hypothetical protein